jgi:hypothetical protein
MGDVCLEISSDRSCILDEFEARYGDCALGERSPDRVDVRCAAVHLPDSSLLWLFFEGRDLPAPIDAGRTPFRMLRHLSRYAQVDGPLPGWRQLVNLDAGNRTLALGDSRTLVIDLDEAPPEFVTDCVVSLVQGVQRGVLFLHAASVGMAGSGALLIGRSEAGKSTTVLALAARGHRFLGDDVAAVRLASREVLPFAKSASLRDGPFARSLDGRIRACRHTTVTGGKGIPRTLVRVGDLFPSPREGPLPLRAAFLLDGFAQHARITPFRPQLSDVRRLKAVVSETTPEWGISPGRDLMKFLTVVDLLSQLRCYLVLLGPPEESAAAIEDAMEASWD